MAYLSFTEFKAHLQDSDIRELSDDAFGENIDKSLVTEILTTASDVCDSYIMVVYTTPVSSDPIHRSLRRATAGIATYLLHVRRSWTVTESVKQEYDECIEWLERVGEGKAEIPGATGRGGDSGSYFTADDQIFTRDSMQGFG